MEVPEVVLLAVVLETKGGSVKWLFRDFLALTARIKNLNTIGKSSVEYKTPRTLYEIYTCYKDKDKYMPVYKLQDRSCLCLVLWVALSQVKFPRSA